MKQILIVLFLSVFVLSCTQQAEETTVHLKGELKNFQSIVQMSKESPKGKLLKEIVEFKLDAQQCFDVTFELSEPSYFDLGRNTLFLSPGDDLLIVTDNDKPEDGVFTGKGAEACDYLKDKPYPKAGSYLYGTDILEGKPSLEELAKRVGIHVAKKQNQVDALKNTSVYFKKIEHGRILFDAANTLMSYGFRAAYTAKVPSEDMFAYADSITAFFKDDIAQYLTTGTDKDFLNTGAYLTVADACIAQLGEEQVDAEVLDFLKVYELVYYLNSKGPVVEVLMKKDSVAASLKTEEYKEILDQAFNKYSHLVPGKMAPVLSMTSVSGEELTLESFRGKIVVIDVWATWCGPCKAESPSFEALAKKYKRDDIEFIAISIDGSEEPWKAYLSKHEKVSTQFITPRSLFKEYELLGVPRFMIIDRDGTFIDAFAPLPSDASFDNCLSELLK